MLLSSSPPASEVWRLERACSEIVVVESIQIQCVSTHINSREATDSISINCKLQISVDFNNVCHLPWAQGVAGSNPVAPTIYLTCRQSYSNLLLLSPSGDDSTRATSVLPLAFPAPSSP